MSETQKKARILICENEIHIAADLADRLKGFGYDVCGQTVSGEEALELAEKLQPDLVMLSIVLQGEMDGIAVAGILEEKWGICVVLLIASSDSDHFDHAGLTFPCGYIFKPFENHELEIATGMALNAARMNAEKRDSDEALLRERKMLARTERVASLGSWEWERATDKVVWSEELFRIFHMEPASMAPCWAEQSTLYNPEDYEVLKNGVEKALVDGTPYELEIRVIRKDGVIRWYVARGFPETDADGQVQRLFGSLQDITERKKTEDKLRESEKRLRVIIENMPVMMNAFDDSNNIIIWNRECERITGYSSEELVGNPHALELLYPDREYRETMLYEIHRLKLNFRNKELPAHL